MRVRNEAGLSADDRFAAARATPKRLAAAVVVALGMASAASATEFVVTDAGDSGLLRQLIEQCAQFLAQASEALVPAPVCTPVTQIAANRLFATGVRSRAIRGSLNT
jgi:predicted peroxiredoxin